MVKPDLLKTIQNEGVELRQRGRRWWGLCPFHSEKIPSLTVNLEKQVFYCFGCGKGGDVFTFIKELKNLSFTEALNYLQVERPQRIVSLQEQERKREDRAFEGWVKSRREELADDFQTINKFSTYLHKPEDLEQYGDLLKDFSVMENDLDILTFGIPGKKMLLFKEAIGDQKSEKPRNKRIKVSVI
jgi:hypothetical protein